MQKVINQFNLGARRRRKLLVSGFFVFFSVFALSYIVGSEFLASGIVKAAEEGAGVGGSSSGSGGSGSGSANDGPGSGSGSGEDGIVTPRAGTPHYISVTSSSGSNVAINVTPNGDTGVGVDRVKVTHNVGRYSLFLSMATSSTDLVKSASGDSGIASIPMTDSSNYSSLVPDHWGFNVVDRSSEADSNPYSRTDFKKIPALNNEIEIASKTGTVNSTNYGYHVLGYGVKASMDKPAGTYQATVKYSVVGDLGANGGILSPTTVDKGAGTTITLTTGIMTNMDTGTWNIKLNNTDCGTVQKQTIDDILVLSCNVPTSLDTGTYTIKAINQGNKYKDVTASEQLTVVDPTYSYSLTYDLGGGSDGPADENGTANGNETKTITIPKIEPTKENKVFLGWADNTDQVNSYTVTHRLYDDSEEQNGTGSNVVSLDKNNPTKTLYAVWADDMTVTANIKNCQNGTESTSTAVHDYIMADPRDKKLYVTRKLKDGQCWMAQNLDLDIAMSSTTMGTTNTVTNDFVKFTNGNTNLSGTEWTITGSNKGYATQTATATSSNKSDKWNYYGSNNSNQSTGDSTYEVRSYDIDKGEPSKACYTNGTTARPCTTPVGAADVTRAGNYYNWPAATAGTGTYQTAARVDVAGSICPAGWQLPYGGSGTGTNGGNTAKGFYYLLNSLGTSSDAPLLANPYSYVRAGLYLADGYVDFQGSGGDYWSRMAGSQRSAYYLNFSSSGVSPGTNHYNKGDGYSVRCVVTYKNSGVTGGDLT